MQHIFYDEKIKSLKWSSVFAMCIRPNNQHFDSFHFQIMNIIILKGPIYIGWQGLFSVELRNCYKFPLKIYILSLVLANRDNFSHDILSKNYPWIDKERGNNF